MSDHVIRLTIPDSFDGQSAMNRITLILAANPLLSALYDYAYAIGARRTSLTIDNKERRLVDVLESITADYSTPATVTPPARQWTGPDAYEARFEAIEIAVPGETDAPADYEAIGPWEPGPVWIYSDWQTPQGVTIPMPVRDWKRALRRIGGQ